MALLKTAITDPVDLLTAVAELALEHRESHSRFSTQALCWGARARHDAEITCKLGALFTDPQIAAKQSQEAAEFDEAGADWSDERW